MNECANNGPNSKLESSRLVCPCCGEAFPFDSFEWLDELAKLVARQSGLNIPSDLSNLSTTEAWGVYQWLRRQES